MPKIQNYNGNHERNRGENTKTSLNSVVNGQKPSVGHSLAGWTGDLRKAAGTQWMRQAEDQVKWRMLGEAYVLQ